MSSPWPEPLFAMIQHERQRQQGSQRQLYALNEGWPFGDGPLQWCCHMEIRPANAFSGLADETHMVCDTCDQSVFPLVPQRTTRGFTWNLELLKSRIADHVLKCHPEAAT